ncbi:MAG TPA: PQQ-binding-like beta-propeller repeat protein, partial [Thermoanaerobaculia bacterium]|nr:PQQ-binding-like beta-propeller repeat protein [Thermoanaerobaculia bacterium]
MAPTAEPSPRKPLRLWPGVALVILQWFLRFGVPVVAPDFMDIGVMASLACGLGVIVWWLFFSRAPWSERLGFLVLIVAAVFLSYRFLLHESIVGGAMGMLYFVLVVPGLCLAFVAALALTRRMADGPRRIAVATAILLSCAVWAFIRTGGFTGSLDNDLAWRWSETPEDRLLAQEPVLPPPPPAPSAAPAPAEAPAAPEETPTAEEAPAPEAPAVVARTAEWPGFRGPGRDGVIHGVSIETDWAAKPPVELWRRPVGPGWSSFAVDGDLIYTQEQRGEDEVVSCYNRTTGEPVWMHRDAARFYESNAGAGPRGTPTLANGLVYALGATGILNALDARDGAV